jgi:hypothetical protein
VTTGSIRSNCDPEDERERALGAGPVLADERLPAAAQKAPQDEGDDHDVVEMAGDGNEVGDEVEGERR